MSDIAEVIDAQIQQKGAVSFKVKDGHVMVFTTETLTELLARAVESAEGRVVVFVKSGVQS